MNLNKIYTPLQQDILKRAFNDDWFMLINDGAKRSGKTVINNELFLSELRRVKKIAEIEKVERPMYILAGYSKTTIYTNILVELSNKYGLKFKFDKYGNFTLFGVYVVTTFHGSIRGLGAIRGMTAYGAYVNEASLANEEVFDEIKSRCSGTGARIVSDTNPDNPEHWLKKDYIDKADNRSIVSYHFTLDDNTFLDERYKQNIKSSTPSGMFYDRNINGLWVSGDGVVYPDFDRNKHIITREEAQNIEFERFFCGVDWGWEHWGAIAVCGYYKGKYYVLEEYSAQHYDIKSWVNVAKAIVEKYGNIPFYCDSARPDNIFEFNSNGINAVNGNKRIMAGIEFISTLMKNDDFIVVYDDMKLFKSEIYKYIWNKLTGEPKKENDDFMDTMRYAIYSDYMIHKNKVNKIGDLRKIKSLF